MMRSMLAIGISGRQVSYPNQARLGFRRDGPIQIRKLPEIVVPTQRETSILVSLMPTRVPVPSPQRSDRSCLAASLLLPDPNCAGQNLSACFS